MNDEIKRKYAQLLLEVGVGLRTGQKLVVCAEPYHWEFLSILTREAYQMGASYVLVESVAPQMLEARVKYAAKESLDYIVGWNEAKNSVMVDEGWARLSLFGPSEPEMRASLDAGRLGIIQQSGSIAGQKVNEACGSGKMAWCVAALPTQKWAAQVFECEASEEAELRLWQEIVKILGLDLEDPCGHWREKSKIIKTRCEKLMGLNLVKVHFKGPGTDLTVQCFENAQWIGGGIEQSDGNEFIPNLPTEECFTTPNMCGTQGRVQVVRPVTVLGKSVEGAWFSFSDGAVVDYGAEKNKDALDGYFKVCPQAKFLGELALVDSSSPIFQSGKVFHCILYDENASCHIALGNGYAMAVPGGLTMNHGEKLNAGVNCSLVHTDFMIGSEEVDVIGYNAEGKEFPLLKNGLFVL